MSDEKLLSKRLVQPTSALVPTTESARKHDKKWLMQWFLTLMMSIGWVGKSTDDQQLYASPFKPEKMVFENASLWCDGNCPHVFKETVVEELLFVSLELILFI